jgi:hypothetical protein
MLAFAGSQRGTKGVNEDPPQIALQKRSSFHVCTVAGKPPQALGNCSARGSRDGDAPLGCGSLSHCAGGCQPRTRRQGRSTKDERIASLTLTWSLSPGKCFAKTLTIHGGARQDQPAFSRRRTGKRAPGAVNRGLRSGSRANGASAACLADAGWREFSHALLSRLRAAIPN